jgi:transcriptional regulator with XRE-family HTH domain
LTGMADTYTEIVIAEVRAEMARQRRGQVELATALGWSQAALSRRLTGSVAFSTDELAQVAGFLGVPISQLVTPPAKAAAS